MSKELSLYNMQLLQVQQQLAICTSEQEKTTLIQLEKDIIELIQLTNDSHDGDLDQQYNIFKAELAAEESKNANGQEQTENDVENDLNSLEGMKCQAPFRHAWSDEPVYHNALVFTVNKTDNLQSVDDVQVTVMFTHPTHADMKPCPYFLEGECRFTADKCRYSHGQIVPLEALREFKNPDFSQVRPGTRVLFKQENGLWTVAKILEISEQKCIVQTELTSKNEETELGSIFPLVNESENDSDASISDLEDDQIEPTQTRMLDVLKQMPRNNALGDWEQYTKGFGSRIMAQMGYIHGSGLGMRAEGRVAPVPAVVYPPGKSLDHCMMLKEKAGGDDDLFKAERKMRKVQFKHQQALTKAYERDKQKTDVFSFLNNRLSSGDGASPENSAKNTSQNQLKSASKKGLNVSSLQISENVMKLGKEKRKLSEALKRHAVDSSVYTSIKEKIKTCDDQLKSLEASERRISQEIKQRDDRKKLTIF